jgi:NAD+ synthetase
MTTQIRVTVLQLNPLVGDVLHNLSQIRRAIERDPTRADLFVTPELALVGYSPRDLLAYPQLRAAEAAALQELASISEQHGIGILVGHTEDRAGTGKTLHNTATLLDNGLCVGRIRKRRMPYYDVFEEERFFESYVGDDQRPLLFRGAKIGVFICEDSWSEVRRYGKNDVGLSPYGDLLEKQLSGADLIVNLSASPYNIGKLARRRHAFAEHAQRHGVPLVFATCVGVQDEILFDGGCFGLNADGSLVASSERFEENELNLVFDKTTKRLTATQPKEAQPSSEWRSLHEALVLGLRDYVHKSGFRRVLIGLSGGIDSALVAALACEALGAENVLGVSLPTRFNSEGTRNDARDLARNLGMEFREVSIEPVLGAAASALNVKASGLAYENMQSRSRGLLLMTLSAQETRLLLATGNKSEFAMGYATLYGDMCGALAPIGDLYKTEVFGLCHWMNARKPIFPLSLLTRAPSAELAPGQRDQDSLPDYAVLDTVLEDMIENQNLQREAQKKFLETVSQHSFERIWKTLHGMEFKRFQAAPILKVHPRAFGSAWRMPLTKGLIR